MVSTCHLFSWYQGDSMPGGLVVMGLIRSLHDKKGAFLKKAGEYYDGLQYCNFGKKCITFVN